MKIVTIPRSKEELLSLLELSDAFIVGVANLAVNLPATFSVEEIRDLALICHQYEKELFIALNKNMHNHDLAALEAALKEIETMNIKGIIFYDISVVNMKKRLNLQTDLVWHQEHMTTNYVTSNYWYQHGAKYTYLSGEITLEEIYEIKNNSKAKIMMQVFGHIPMFVSKRHLVKNYLKTFNLPDSDFNYLEKDGLKYPIIDNELGTVAYSSYLLNALPSMLNIKNNQVDYVVLNSFNVLASNYLEIVKMFKTVDAENISTYQQKINEMYKCDFGFLYKETIYKVKNNE